MRLSRTARHSWLVGTRLLFERDQNAVLLAQGQTPFWFDEREPESRVVRQREVEQALRPDNSSFTCVSITPSSEMIEVSVALFTHAREKFRGLVAFGWSRELIAGLDETEV